MIWRYNATIPQKDFVANGYTIQQTNQPNPDQLIMKYNSPNLLNHSPSLCVR